MRVLYKSSTDEMQLRDRIKKGNKKMELHMTIEDAFNIDDAFNRIIGSGAVIYVVHMPIDLKYNIEATLNRESRAVMREISKLSQKLSNYYSHNIDIVMHMTLEVWQIKDFGIYGRILSFVDELLHRFPGIRISFENTSPYVMQGNLSYLSNAYYLSPLELAYELRRDLETDRIGVVFDVCHSLNSVSHSEGAFRNKIFDKWTMQEHFELYLPLMNVLHLSYAKNWGIGKDHGVGFNTKEDEKVLYWILDELLKYKYSGVVTLELMEEDMLNAMNQEKLYGQVKKYIKIKSH